MELSRNTLVDAFDALSGCTTPDETWQCAVDVSRALGVPAINIGALNMPTRDILWARSSMEQTWLDRYTRENFAAIDPLVDLFATPEARQTIYCDPVSVAAGTDGGHPVLSLGLSQAGYTLLHGTKLTSLGDPVGKIVTLCFDGMMREKFDATVSQWTIFAAMLGGFTMAPSGSADQDVFAYGKPTLTPREIEVLGFLGAGFQTARIAGELKLAEVTVAKHMRSAREKLGAATREQALVKAMQLGLIQL